MKKREATRRLLVTIVLLCLTLLFSLTLTACNKNAGSEEILSAEELAENVARGTASEHDYVWKYLDEWCFPAFSATKLQQAEHLFMTEFYKEIPDSAALAASCAEVFIDKYYSKTSLTDTAAVTDALIISYVAAIGDKYSTYRTPTGYQDYKAESSGTLVGIGVNVTECTHPAGIFVNYTYDGSPAEAAGILAGDIITAVDGTTVEAVGFDAAADLIRGEIGTYVNLTVLRGEEVLTLSVIRANIVEKTVSYSLSDGVGYIRISSFKSNTAEQFREAIDYMKENGAAGVIYDLRANLGGYLDTVLEMLEYLAPKGTTLVSFSNGYGDPVIDSTDHCYYPPSVVLTDYNTASAAELFTAGVCDLADMGYGTAITVGKTTRGKGVMQATYKFSDGSAITMTVAYYNPPSGVNYHEVGIIPDVEVDLTGEGDSQLERAYEELGRLTSDAA